MDKIFSVLLMFFEVFYITCFIFMPFGALELYKKNLNSQQYRLLQKITLLILFLGFGGFFFTNTAISLEDKVDSFIQNTSVELLGGIVLLVFFGFITQVLGELGNKRKLETKNIAAQQEEVLNPERNVQNNDAEININGESSQSKFDTASTKK
jgi:hypothetical protein